MRNVDIKYVTEDEREGIQLSPDLYVYQGHCTDEVIVADDGKTRPEILYQRFLNLLLSSTIKPHKMETYAQKLCVSAKYLSYVCRKQSGKTAPQIICEYIMNDARRYLSSTDLSVKEIAFRLNFSNYAFFCKTVKNHFGMSPLKGYRSSEIKRNLQPRCGKNLASIMVD